MISALWNTTNIQLRLRNKLFNPFSLNEFLFWPQCLQLFSNRIYYKLNLHEAIYPVWFLKLVVLVCIDWGKYTRLHRLCGGGGQVENTLSSTLKLKFLGELICTVAWHFLAFTKPPVIPPCQQTVAVITVKFALQIPHILATTLRQ